MSTLSGKPINSTLFPPPRPQSVRNPIENPLAPNTWPGITPASTETVQQILTENWEKHHVFFNERGFHNHIVHAALTLWALGAPPAIIEASYHDAASYQRPIITPPNAITRENWRNHVGDERFYAAYRDFFLEELKAKGTVAVLAEYIYAPDANYVSGLQKQPEMLGRFFEGLLHPMIHVGFGLEFGLDAIVAEGLAQTAVHRILGTALIPATWFNLSTLDGLTNQFSQTTITPTPVKKQDTHIFSVLGRVLADPELDQKITPSMGFFFADVLAVQAAPIRKHVEDWVLYEDGGSAEGKEVLRKKGEELVWLNSLLYAVAGASKMGDDKKEPFNADFFLMHLVTSSLFLPTLLSESVTPSSAHKILLLKAYLSFCLTWYIGRGRPQLDLVRFFKDPVVPGVLTHPTPGPQPTPHTDALPSSSAPEATTPNAWYALLQSTLVHPDDHLAKLQRALVTWDLKFGSSGSVSPVVKGAFAGSEGELKGAGEVDATLFVRAARLSMDRMGWVREGQVGYATLNEGLWDRSGFFEKKEVPRL